LSSNRSTTPQQWEDFSRYNKERADAEMANSKRLREAIHHTLQQTENDLEAQHTATDYATRKRIHEFERAIDELNWQKQQVSYLGQKWTRLSVMNSFRKYNFLIIFVKRKCVLNSCFVYHRLRKRLLSWKRTSGV